MDQITDSVNMDKFNFIVLPPPECDKVWPFIMELLRPVVDISFGEVTLSGIKTRIEDGTELAVCVFEDKDLVAVCILGISEFETGKRVLQMPYCGGKGMNEWLIPGFEVIRKIAKEHECTHIRGCGRPGWERALPELKKIRTVYECEV
jgi:hypothetical protein